MQTWLICFDISDDRRRRQVGSYLAEYGLRVQRSVFEVSVRSAAQMTKLQNSLASQLEDTDDLRLYRLCADCRRGSVNLQGEAIADFPQTVVL